MNAADAFPFVTFQMSQATELEVGFITRLSFPSRFGHKGTFLKLTSTLRLYSAGNFNGHGNCGSSRWSFSETH
jgi:hypothetical protein